MLSQRTQEKVDKYRAGYAAQGMRHAFLPAVVSTSGRIHGDLFRLRYILADKKTTRYFEALGEAVDVDSEAYCWRRSGFFWRMRAFPWPTVHAGNYPVHSNFRQGTPSVASRAPP